MNELKRFSSFEELKADGKPTENMEETIRRYKEYEEGIILAFVGVPNVKKSRYWSLVSACRYDDQQQTYTQSTNFQPK